MKLLQRVKKLIDKYKPREAKKLPPSENEEDFINDSRAAILSKSMPLVHTILYIIIALVIIGFIWSYFAIIEQSTVGTGKVIPSSQVKIIQSLDGGIVTQIPVHEGEIVKQNQLLMQLDDTRYKSEFSANYSRYLVLAAMVARLNAEEQERDHIDFPEDVKKHPKIVELENKLFENRKKSLQEELAALKENYEIAMKQTGMYQSLLAKGYSSKLEYLRSLQSATEIKTKIIEKQNQFRDQIKTDLAKNEGELKSLIEALQSLQDKMIHTTIRSPVYGVVKKIHVVTVGGVISPGMNIMEIVPLTDTLLIQARISPADIAFVHVGQAATVKLTAYDFSIYGGLPGTVEYISADTIQEGKANDMTVAQSDSGHFYIVNVRVKKNYLSHGNQKLFIIPGMVATVHIETGKKTILQYLLKPLIKAKEEALRER